MCGFSDSVSIAGHKVEYEFPTYERYKEKSLNEKMTINISGRDVKGEFKETEYRGFNYYPIYEYEDENGNSFHVNPEGLLVGYSLNRKDRENEIISQDKTISQDDSIAIAKEFLSNIVDVTKYQISVKEKESLKMYEVSFTKYVGELKTTDSATVDVIYSGEISSYSSFMLGKVSDVQTYNFDLESVKASITNRLDEIYAEAKTKYDRVVYEEPTFLLTNLKDGSVGLVCYLDVKCVSVIGEYEAYISDRVCMVVFK